MNIRLSSGLDLPRVLLGLLVLLIVPYATGYFVATETFRVIEIVFLFAILIPLMFAESRYLIVATALVLLLSGIHVLAVSERCMILRWVFLIALALRAVMDRLLRRVSMHFRSVDLWAFTVLALAFFSQSYSLFPQLTLQRNLSLVFLYLATFWGVSNYVQDEDRARIIVHDFLKIAFVIFLLGLTVFFRVDAERGRFMGFFLNPNAIGFYAILILPLSLWSLHSEGKKWVAFLILLILVSLLLSRPRAGMIGAAISVGYYLSFYRFWQRRALWTCLFFIPVILVLYHELFGLTSIVTFLRMDWKTFMEGGGRLEAWGAVLRLIALRPWLGYGFGTEDRLFEEFDIIFKQHQGAYAHNAYLGFTSQLGLIGSAIFFIPLIFFFFHRSYQISRTPLGDSTYGLRLAINAVFLGILFHAFFESHLYSAGNAFIFSFWALVVVAYQLDRLLAYNDSRVSV